MLNLSKGSLLPQFFMTSDIAVGVLLPPASRHGQCLPQGHNLEKVLGKSFLSEIVCSVYGMDILFFCIKTL